ncbi:MAG TPA: phosphatidate cytidylyltransferase [Candidatus Eremiobacteraeota bacterium]|nr:phosphatidate cytidylyltransferase [Candidatus Eremiobacteraeota bacterium]
MKLLIKASVSFLLIGYVIFLYISGKIVASIGISVFILGSLYEFYGLCEKLQLKPLKVPGLLISILLIYEAYKNNLEGMIHVLLLTILGTFLILILDKRHLSNALLDAAVTIFGLLYVVFPMCHLILLCVYPCESRPNGLDLFLFIILCNSTCDMSANGIGSWLGRHKILTHVSPNKSIEGTLGGIIMAVLIAIPVGYFIKFPFYHSLLGGLCIAITGVIGDFGESLIKRSAGVKDAGNLFVEHGGMLDRCDSLFMSSFCFYFYLIYFFFR